MTHRIAQESGTTHIERRLYFNLLKAFLRAKFQSGQSGHKHRISRHFSGRHHAPALVHVCSCLIHGDSMFRSTVQTLLRGSPPSTGHIGKGFLGWRVGELCEENEAEIFNLGSLAPLTQSITVQARKNVCVLKVPSGTGQVSVIRN